MPKMWLLAHSRDDEDATVLLCTVQICSKASSESVLLACFDQFIHPGHCLQESLFSVLLSLLAMDMGRCVIFIHTYF